MDGCVCECSVKVDLLVALVDMVHAVNSTVVGSPHCMRLQVKKLLIQPAEIGNESRCEP